MGLGKLGSPLAACFAASGFRVHAVDAEAEKVETITRGTPPVHEPGLAELISKSEGRLSASQDAERAVRESDATFVVVSTPSEASGGFSLRYVLPVCESIGRALRTKPTFHLVVLTSTVMPESTGGEVKAALEQASGKICGSGFGLCYSPEFVALGSVIRDFYNPDFLLIGESDQRSGDILADIYRRVCKNSPPIARMNFVSAEITKLAVNTYVTTKISFANMIARLCECLPGADASSVTDALGLDSRIGRKYLQGAVSYGGPCFPRDNRAMAALATRAGAFSELAEVTDRLNRAQVGRIADLTKRHYSGNGPIGILGLTYKPDTNVVEESFGLLLAGDLTSANLPVVAYDPSAEKSQVRAINERVEFVDSAQECVEKSDVVVIATAWAQFHQVPRQSWARHSPARTVIDCWRAFTRLDGVDGVRYMRLGFGEVERAAKSASTLQGY
jgi:UDPglucose 6-dehydrogenase